MELKFANKFNKLQIKRKYIIKQINLILILVYILELIIFIIKIMKVYNINNFCNRQE